MSSIQTRSISLVLAAAGGTLALGSLTGCRMMSIGQSRYPEPLATQQASAFKTSQGTQPVFMNQAAPEFEPQRRGTTPGGSNPAIRLVTSDPSPTPTDSRNATDGWRFVEAASGAEPFSPSAPQPPRTTTTGPNMAAQLYGELLGTEIPGDGGFLGQHTTNMRQVSFTHEGSDFDPSVSRDGRHLVFASTQHRPTADVYIKQVGSRVLTRLTDDPAQDVMPTISPESDRIAFSSNRTGNWDVWMMSVNGGKAVQVTSDNSHDLHPSFSPDGQHVVYCRLGQTSGRWELWVSDVYDNASSQFIGYGLFPEWAPIAGTGAGGSDQILFQRSRERGDRTFAVWTMDFDPGTMRSGRETQIASDPQFALINPSWSPAGDRIAFAAVPNPESWIGEGATSLPPSASVWMVGIDGRGEVPLTSGNSIDLMPAWSSRGQVLFVSNRTGVENLWSLDIAPAILAATGEDPEAPRGNDAFAGGPQPASGASGAPQAGFEPSGPGVFATVPTDGD
ncbi:MAG: DPP IV N-terminal domain-containing protein [Planctomycetota bacterium]